ncbi:MAG: type II/IV secretion system ATPase subunit [Candidatus Nanoarchaeia archaeon]|nr:type II/IV secretion system ATPase subunit [Candidatus Nanoarchaeia archaeon]
MADENTKVPPGGYQIVKEGNEDIMRVNYEQAPYSPSVEDNAMVMMDAIDKLAENPSVARLIFLQRRFYEYSYEQTQMLVEVANLYSYLIKSKKVLSPDSLGASFENQGTLAERYAVIHSIVFELLRSDPLGAYVEIKRVLRAELAKQDATKEPRQRDSREIFLGLLKAILTMFEEMKIVKAASQYLAGYNIGDRSIYKIFFRAVIAPDFMFTRVMANPPMGGEEMEVYSIDKDTSVTIFRVPDDIKFLYHMTPPEFTISEDKYALVDMAKTVLSEHKPKEDQFLDPHKLRNTFSNIGKDLLRELAEAQNVELSMKDIKLLTEIIIRHTIGFGFMELILKDPRVQDVQINSPNGEVPIFVLHETFGNCTTNLIPARTDTESWASKFRLLSGRPLDEANPILDTELHLPNSTSRVSMITKPLNPFGLAFSFRRHRDEPWTLPLFVKNRMLNPLAAGLISFLVDGTRTLLVAGTRSSGKTSLLGACMIEIMRKNRILTVEDTLELPTEAMRKLNYDIQPLKVRAALMEGGTEMSAAEGIRTSLRMGNSALIIGEVRSKEAIALYEAMRIGAMANTVAGTIHGDSPYGVYDRVVNDLGVPKTSFKATDIIIVANPLKSPDGLHTWRRITQITEVRKEWEEDPMTEGAFVDLMRYNSQTDQLEPTPELINGESEILKALGANVKEWTGNWDAIWDNIMLRADIKKLIVDYAARTKNPLMLEAKFVIQANDVFHRISEQILEEAGHIDTKKILFEWEEWLKKEVRKHQME